ncbi:MAG: hypothetical protein D6826_04600 [Alphaproteobacteria bacterium]|nr:MAG: hypothetical protein D6826_04600 [Alphaproteobacteria bacterium]
MTRRVLLRRTVEVAAGGMLGGALGTAVGGLRPVRAGPCEIFPPDGTARFLMRRGNRVIGRHDIRFARRNGRFIVRSDVRADIGNGGWRFRHHAEEVWREGWLHAVVSDTDDDGRRYRVRAERRGGIFGGTVNGTGFTVSGYLIPSSLWHHDTIAVEALFDTVDARVKLVRSYDLGAMTVAVGGRPVLARHYRQVGEIAREVWYDAGCRLVQVAFIARGGVPVTVERT